MKTKILLIALFITGLCVQPAFVQAKKKTETLSSFSGISLSVAADVYLTQGNEQIVEVVADDETLEKLIVEVKNETLIIRFPSENNLFRNFKPGKIEIFVTAKNIDKLNVAGSGGIIAKDELSSSNISLSVTGSGDIKLENLKANSVNATVTGSGDIYLKGKSKTGSLNAVVSGSGSIKAGDLEAESANATVTGSGKCNVYSNGSINAKTTGSGNVYYSGSANINAHSTGSGKIVNQN